ncbi:cysteine--tRNA ligase [bacterium]|nr:cysteine--tRNA ligase [bacterium]
MPIKFYNTLTKQKDEFQPIRKGEVKLYTCGPTVYDTAHIGNFRTFLFEDLLKRYLILKGYQVTHVMNLTDVDDKTILRCNSDHISIHDLTEKYIKLFFDDLHRLKIIPADFYPKATEHVPEMIDMVKKLIDNGYAYKSEDNSIYFNIKKFEKYGKLANLNFAEQKTTQRIATDDYSKDHPQDFVLWKAWKKEDGKVYWESPWGKGRPGWHIECSAMSNKYLGENFDIHCGGVDNIFPHHENEIAQSECANNKPFVNYWLHSEHLLVDGRKMSKSAGNFYKISDLTDMGFTPEALRYLLLSGHYRTNINFSVDKKHEALKVIQRINDFYKRLLDLSSNCNKTDELPEAYNLFIKALDDDLNTPEALAVFFEWMRNTNAHIDNNILSDKDIIYAINFIDEVNVVFDLLISRGFRIPTKIVDLANQRQTARINKDWIKADSIRDQILKLGWIIEDAPHIGYKLKSVLEK